MSNPTDLDATTGQTASSSRRWTLAGLALVALGVVVLFFPFISLDYNGATFSCGPAALPQWPARPCGAVHDVIRFGAIVAMAVGGLVAASGLLRRRR